MENGAKNHIIKWLISSLWGILIIVISLIGNNVIANQNTNVKVHADIRKEYKKDDEKIVKKVDEVLNIVTDVRIQQTEIKTILKALANK